MTTDELYQAFTALQTQVFDLQSRISNLESQAHVFAGLSVSDAFTVVGASTAMLLSAWTIKQARNVL